MTIIAIAGDEIVCSNGHVCGTLLIDVNSGDRIVFPKYRFDGKSPFSLEFYPKVDTRPDGHMCNSCGEPITRCRNSAWQISTRQGWVGELAKAQDFVQTVALSRKRCGG